MICLHTAYNVLQSEIPACTVTPINERQTRPLTRLETPEAQQYIINQARKASNEPFLGVFLL